MIPICSVLHIFCHYIRDIYTINGRSMVYQILVSLLLQEVIVISLLPKKGFVRLWFKIFFWLMYLPLYNLLNFYQVLAEITLMGFFIKNYNALKSNFSKIFQYYHGDFMSTTFKLKATIALH